MSDEKIVYSLEIIKSKNRDGRSVYNCEYHNDIDGADDEVGVMQLLWSEFNSLMTRDIDTFNVGNKGAKPHES
jgi:hypothetical protein